MPVSTLARVSTASSLGEFSGVMTTPTEQLKSLDNSEAVSTYTEALTRLFALSNPADEPSDRDRGAKAGRVEAFKRPTGRH